MDEELLSDILAAEREIRRQIDATREESAARLEALRLECEATLEQECRTLQGEGEEAQCRAEEMAQTEGEALLAAARSFAERLDRLTPEELDLVVRRQLQRLLPEGVE